jgi:hypothetical protein
MASPETNTALRNLRKTLWLTPGTNWLHVQPACQMVTRENVGLRSAIQTDGLEGFTRSGKSYPARSRTTDRRMATRQRFARV